MPACTRIVTASIFLFILTTCSIERDKPVYYRYEQNFHTVLKGDTLYSIAYQHGLDYQQLAAWNSISKPYTIFPGQKLRLKGLASPTKSPKTVTASKDQAEAGAISGGKKRKATKPVQTSKPAKPVKLAKGGQYKWVWPTRGKVIRKYSVKGRGNKGIDIAGKEGQAILAASSGKVVYSGNGLPGYGNLIIVKHSERYLSAYAHNSKLLVKEGRTVTRGQKIAELGSTGAQSPRLHFEIRQYGKPVDPLRYLPRL